MRRGLGPLYGILGRDGAVTERLMVVAFTSDCPVFPHRAVGPNPTRSTLLERASRATASLLNHIHS
jgi:hypothetical protein